MNVLMISDVYFPRINGVSTSIETFRHELERLGTRSTLIAPEYPRENDTPAQANDAGIVRIPSRYLPLDPEDRVMKLSEIKRWLADVPQGHYDIVHIQTPFLAHYAGLQIARKLGIPALATYHTYFEEYLHHYVPIAPRSWMRALARGFSRSQCNALNAVVVPSSAMKATLTDYGVSAPLHVLPTGLPDDRFSGGDGKIFRAHYGIPPERPLLLFVGRVAFEKNIGFLIDVVERVRAEIPEVLLLVTGEGPALDSLRRDTQARGLGDNVRYLGYLDRNRELADCYRAADLFVFASRTETQGLVLLEAMALGTPVVALSAMGTRDILEQAQGAQIAQDDVADFAAKIVALLHDPVRRSAMSGMAQQYARTWGAAAMADRLNGLYADICAHHRDARRMSEQVLGSS